MNGCRGKRGVKRKPYKRKSNLEIQAQPWKVQIYDGTKSSSQLTNPLAAPTTETTKFSIIFYVAAAEAMTSGTTKKRGKKSQRPSLPARENNEGLVSVQLNWWGLFGGVGVPCSVACAFDMIIK